MVGQFTTLNLQARYTGIEHVKLLVGVDNVFDEKPPFAIGDGDTDLYGYVQNVHNPRGPVLECEGDLYVLRRGSAGEGKGVALTPYGVGGWGVSQSGWGWNCFPRSAVRGADSMATSASSGCRGSGTVQDWRRARGEPTRFGAMRITGRGIWGEPADPRRALRTLKRLPALGVNFIDTADSYGPKCRSG